MGAMPLFGSSFYLESRLSFLLSDFILKRRMNLGMVWIESIIQTRFEILWTWSYATHAQTCTIPELYLNVEGLFMMRGLRM